MSHLYKTLLCGGTIAAQCLLTRRVRVDEHVAVRGREVPDDLKAEVLVASELKPIQDVRDDRLAHASRRRRL